MDAVELTHLSVRRTRLTPWIDFGGFFMFFGVSGIDHGRQRRLEKRFEQEHYRNRTTVKLSARLAPGTYRLDGLPEDANRRGWTVHANGAATSDLSDEGLESLQAWMNRKPCTVRPIRF